jgi:hypothetical protein
MARARSLLVASLLSAALAGCGGAVEPTEVVAEPPSTVPTAAPSESSAAIADTLTCGEASGYTDPKRDVVHWSGSAVEPISSSPFVDIRQVVVSRDEHELCVDIETVKKPRDPSFFDVRFWDATTPQDDQVVSAELAFVGEFTGARLGHPGAEDGPDPRLKFGVSGRHVWLRLPREAFPDWSRVAQFQWRVEARNIQIDNRDYEPYDHAPDPCVRVQWPDGTEYDATGIVAC